MRLMQARELFRQLTATYFSGAQIVFTNQSRAAKQKQPLVVITTGNVNRPSNPNYDNVDGVPVSYYLSRLPITVDLFTNGFPVIDEETGQTVAYEDNALDDMLSFADFLNSPYTVRWSHDNDVAIVIDGDVMNMTGLVNDNNYEYRARLNVLFFFTQKAVGDSAVLSEKSVVYPTGDPDHPYTDEEPKPSESTTGGYETDYDRKNSQSTVDPVYEPTSSGGGSEELSQESAGYFEKAEIKEEKGNE